MKKQLLLLAMAVMGAASATAQTLTVTWQDNAWRTGDAFYTEIGKWAIQGENLLPNGDFTQGETKLDGWGNFAGENGAFQPADESVFQVIEGVGPYGDNAIEVLTTVTGANTTTSTNGELFQTVSLEPGNYVMGYWVKAADGVTRTLSTSAGSSNYQGLFLNNDGTKLVDATAGTGNQGMQVAAKGLNYGDGWTQVFYQFTISESLDAQVLLYNLQAGDQFAGFGIYPVAEAFDERPYLTLIEQMDTYLANTADFPNNRDELAEAKTALEEMVAEGSGDESAIAEVNDILTEFLDANTYNIGADAVVFPNFLVTQSNGMNKGVPTGWKATTGRWGTGDASNNFNVSRYPTNFAWQDIQAGFDGYVNNQIYREAELPPGRYMFTTRMNAARYTSTGTARIVSFVDTLEVKAYINTDTITLLSGPTHYVEGTVFGEVAEGADMVRIGVKFPDLPKSRGMNHGFSPVEFRMLGGKSDELKEYAYYTLFGRKAQVQQDTLAGRIALVKAMLEDRHYVYGKALLSDSLASAEAEYALPVEATLECYQRKLNKVNYIKRAWEAYQADNKEYTTLTNTMAVSEGHLADPERTVKDKLQAVYDGAAAYRSSITGAETSPEDSVAQKSGLTEWNEKLVAANADFYLDNSSLATPGDITLVNPKVSSATGWTVGGSGTSGVGYSEQYGFKYNRNYKAASDWFTRLQSVQLQRPGVYEFSATMAANKFGAKYETTYVFLETHQGGEMDANNKYFYGTEENPILLRDSVMVCTPAPTDGEYSVVESDMVRVTTHVVVTDVTKPLVVGLNAARNNINGNSQACCQIIFGQCELKYLGEYEKYRKDSIALVMKPTKDALQEKIDELRGLGDEARNPNSVDVTPFTNALATAQSIHDNSEDIDEVNAQFDALEAARQAFVLSGVYPAEGKYYDLSFMIKNRNFDYQETTTGEGDEAVTKRTINDWTEQMADGQNFNVSVSPSGSMLYGKNYTGVEETIDEVSYMRTKLNQQVNGLPAGAYKFGFNVTYHKGRNNVYVLAEYATANEVFVTTSTDTTAVYGIVQEQFEIEGGNESYSADQYSTYLVYNENLKLLLYDYRHGTAAIGTLRDAFNQGYYLYTANLDVAAGEQPVVGFYLQNMPSTDSNFFLMNPTLFFYGDDANREKVQDGIATPVDFSRGTANEVYTLSGVRLGGQSLQKGIYIVNGKKVVVK